jgi:CubicO group peptidase (beta-lactamase class C family)
MKWKAVIGVMLALLSPRAWGAELPDTRVLESTVKDSLRAWEVPGAAVVVVFEDRVVFLEGFGIKEQGGKDAVTPDTVFALGSCSKAFTTTLMAIMVDEGKIGWDDPVRKHLDYFHLHDPLADTGVSLRDLVTHRTGLGSHDLLWYRSPLTLQDRVRRMALLEPAYPFRSGYQYQTTMFTAAGLAVQAAAGEKWTDLVQKRIFDPLNMKNATLTSAGALKTTDHATPHRHSGRGSIEAVDWYEMKEADPAGSVSASARDLGQWLRLHLGGGTVDGKRLLSTKNLEETHTPQNVIRMDPMTQAVHSDTNLMSYAMGWVVHDYRGQRLISHAGLIDGFRVQITMVPEKKLGIAVLTNLHDSRMPTSVCCSMVDAFLGLKRRNWDDYLLQVAKEQSAAQLARRKAKDEERRPDMKPSRELSAYAGAYQDDAYGKMEIKLKGGKLVLHWNAFSSPLEHFKVDTFTVDIGPSDTFDLEFRVTPKTRDVTSFKISDPIGREFKRVTPE